MGRKGLMGIGLDQLSFLSKKLSSDLIRDFTLEILYLAFALYNKAYRYGLYTPCGEPFTDFLPQYRGEFIPYQAIEYTTCLLGIDQIIVNSSRVLYSMLYGGLSNGVEDNTLGLLLRELKLFRQMPSYGFPLTVFIGSQPYCIGFLHFFFEGFYKVSFIGSDQVLRLESMCYIDP